MTNFRPYQLASIQLPTSTRRRVVEVISYPIDRHHVALDTIMIRMVPGEPTTITEVKVADLLPYQKQRWCVIAEVRTRFTFPEDMLRYDCAALYDHTAPEDSDEYCSPDKPMLIYRVQRLRSHAWTYDRWVSFSALVKNLQVHDLNKEQP